MAVLTTAIATAAIATVATVASSLLRPPLPSPSASSTTPGAAGAHCCRSRITARNDVSPGSVWCDSEGRWAPGREALMSPRWGARRREWRPSPTPSVSCRSGGTVDFSSDYVEEEEEEVGEDVVPAPPPTDGRIDIVVTKEAVRQLDLSAAHAVLRKFVHQVGDNATAPSSDPKELLSRTVGFTLQYEPDDAFDPRELSEMPDIRLWFVRLDETYPWLPIVLDWRAGELVRYAAMLVPHQMSKRQGLVFNPEALELFAMRKVFLLYSWLQLIGISKPKSKVNDMLKMLGFSITDQLYSLIEQYPPP